VLCGLGASLEEPEGTVLRIAKGAALDRCGHEIVVGHDHCIDVDAWYRRERDAHLDADPTSTWPEALLDGDGKLPLRVALSYRECPSKPEPAPRDTCSCSEGGSDYGRVNEEFELALVPREESEASLEPELFPARAAIDDAVFRTGGPALLEALAELVTASCPEPVTDDRLVLATFRAALAADKTRVVRLEDLSGTPILLSTAVLQHLLLAHLAVAPPDDVIDPSDGPEITDVTLERVDATHYRFRLSLSGTLVGATVQPDHFRLVRLTSVGWDAPAASALSSEYVDGTEPRIEVTVRNDPVFLEAGGLFRLSLSEEESEDPIVDDRMRRLRPARFAKDFALEDDGGTLRISKPPYAV
jgi:hypothetical protein